MTRTHKAVCERCGKKEDLKKPKPFGRDDYELPENWERINAHHAGVTTDLCFECFKDFMAVEEYFFMQEVGDHLDLKEEELQAHIKTGDDE